MSNKNQPSIHLTHAGYNVRVVLDRKGIAYPIWGAPSQTMIDLLRKMITEKTVKDPSRRLPPANVRSSFKPTLEKTARQMGAKGWVRI